MNIRAGVCIDCGSYWTVSGGGLNDSWQCKECERKYLLAEANTGGAVMLLPALWFVYSAKKLGEALDCLDSIHFDGGWQ